MTLAEQETESIDVVLEDKPDTSDFGFKHLFKIPKVVWQHLTDSKRKSTHAVISGLNISIYTFGERQLPEDNDDPTEPLPVVGSEDNSTPIFGFTQVGVLTLSSARATGA